jgi:phospholipase/carboxylesterase
MNRLPHPLDELLSLPTESFHVEQPNYAVELARLSIGSESLPHTLFAPLHYESGYAYPLIVWLHGPGDDEQQLKRIMPLVSMRNYVSIAPRGTQPVCTVQQHEGFTWRQSHEGITQAERRVLATLDLACERYHIAAHRIFVAGFQTGGTMALRVALNNPDKFAGAISLGGAFPQGQQPLRRLNELRRLPLCLATGTESELYPQTAVCQDLKLFHSAGLSVDVRQYPGEDDLTTSMLADMNRWVMDRVCGAAASTSC